MTDHSIHSFVHLHLLCADNKMITKLFKKRHILVYLGSWKCLEIFLIEQQNEGFILFEWLTSRQSAYLLGAHGPLQPPVNSDINVVWSDMFRIWTSVYTKLIVGCYIFKKKIIVIPNLYQEPQTTYFNFEQNIWSKILELGIYRQIVANNRVLRDVWYMYICCM